MQRNKNINWFEREQCHINAHAKNSFVVMLLKTSFSKKICLN